MMPAVGAEGAVVDAVDTVSTVEAVRIVDAEEAVGQWEQCVQLCRERQHSESKKRW